jgi:hypothetical protein
MNKKKLNKTRLIFFILLTNLCSFAFSMNFSDQKKEIERTLNIKKSEALIRIPVKLFIGQENFSKNLKEVTVKDKYGEIVFERANLYRIIRSEEDKFPAAQLVIDKNQLNKNLDREYFQITPPTPIIRKLTFKKKSRLNEIIF